LATTPVYVACATLSGTYQSSAFCASVQVRKNLAKDFLQFEHAELEWG